MLERPRQDAVEPRLQTLLLTDLCDSTAVIERLGDVAAARLFRDHDRLVLQLQQRWRGRLIDRSDGLFLLFDRPVDGLGFALDYQRGLGPLGKPYGVQLAARAGLHVGEVVFWTNDEAAVRDGAKPVEAEGLAKPVAARLMAMARPGQILLSPTAEAMARRAAGELGAELAGRLVWKSHGRWRLKGVPAPLEVHEVGEAGQAPLKVPRPAAAKAWRDVPLWRRPAMLAVQVLAAVALGIAAWLLTRPEPAIAFAERSWVVLGDLHNTTGRPVLDKSVEQALRLSLGQSRHVNVLSDQKVRDTLARMRKSPDTPIDRDLAAEIAIRDGAWGVILPTVSEVGGRVHVTLELVEPRTREVLYAASAAGDGLDSVLASVDKVASDLRERLGETRRSQARDFKPLPRVATASLDALHAYALGQEAYAQGNFVQAADSYRRAIELDPDFALAHIGLMRAYNALDQLPRGVPHLRRAQALRDGLASREQMYLDAWGVQVDDPGRAADAWMLVARAYPDFFQAHANVAYALEVRNQHAEALPYAVRAAAPQSEFAPLSMELLGRVQMVLGERKASYDALVAASRRGVATAQAWLAVWHALGDDFEAAEAAWPADGQLKQTLFERVSIYLDQRKWDAARMEAARVRTRASADGPRARQSLMPGAVVAWALGDHAAARKGVDEIVEAALAAVVRPDNAMDQRDDAALALYGAILGLRMGQRGPARRVLEVIEARPKLAAVQPVNALLAVVHARLALLDGQAEKALAALDTIKDGTEPMQAYVARMEAHLALGDVKAAAAQAGWLARNRALAYAEYGCAWCQQAMNVVDARLAALNARDLEDPEQAPRVGERMRSPPARVLAAAAVP